MLCSLKQLILTVLFALFASQASAMFIQPDWFDPTEKGVGTNRYAYSGNDPINQRDPSGNAFHDWGMDQEEADADNQNRADSFYEAAQRLRDSDRFIDRLSEFLGSANRLERAGDHYQSRIGVSTQDRITRDIGEVAAEALMGLRPNVRAGVGMSMSPSVPGGGLITHELAGGHLIARHVGLTDAQLIGRLTQQQRIKAASTFTNLGVAESQVSVALAANRVQITRFLLGNGQRLVINHKSSRVIGRIVTRGSTSASPATNVRVVLQRDPAMSTGYRIVTGFPVP